MDKEVKKKKKKKRCFNFDAVWIERIPKACPVPGLPQFRLVNPQDGLSRIDRKQ